MTKEYIEREAVKSELLSWAVCMNHPEYLIKDDALHIIDSIPAADVAEKEVLTMTEYIENPLSGKLRGVTYEDGKIIDVHIRDTDDVVKVFVPVRPGRWVFGKDLPYGWGQIPQNKYHLYCSECLEQAFNRSEDNDPDFDVDTSYCANCGAIMDGGDD